MQVSYKIALIGACLAALFSVFVPLQTILHNLYVEHHPVAGFLHIQHLLHGAHQSLLVTKSCELGVFDALAVGSGDRSTCVEFDSLKVELERRRQTTQLLSNKNIRDGKLKILLEALVATNLVRHCTPPSGGEGGYGLTIHAARHLVNPAVDTSVDPDFYFCGMGMLGNSKHVIHSLLTLDDTLFEDRVLREAEEAEEEYDQRLVTTNTGFKGEERASAASGKELADLWMDFASHSAEFVRFAARSVSTELLTQVLSHNTNKAVEVADIGCGSGEFLRVLADMYTTTADHQPTFTAVQFDLPEVVEVTKRRYLATGKEDAVTMDFVGGNVFNDSSIAAIAHTWESRRKTSVASPLKMVLMNSFLQHFGDDDCVGILQRVAKTLKVGDGDLVVAVTELDVPQTSYNPLKEWSPMGHIFSAVVSSFTVDGRVRTTAEYAALGEKAGAKHVTIRSFSPKPFTVTLMWF